MKKEETVEIKRAVVTGGAGFIGSNLVDELVTHGIETKVIDNLLTGRVENINPVADFVKVDVRNFEDVRKELEGFDVVFHLAALPRISPSIKEPVLYHEINVTGTLNVLKAGLDTGIKNIVYAASSSCYGNPSEPPTSENATINPLNPYAYQKYIGELYCKMFYDIYDLPTCSLRIFNPFGDRSYRPDLEDAAYTPVVGVYLYRWQNNLPLQITGDGKQRRDFVHVHDLVRAFYLAGMRRLKGESINIGAGYTTSILELAQRFGCECEFIEKRPGEAEMTWANIDLAKKLLGWQPKLSLWEYIDEKIKQT